MFPTKRLLSALVIVIAGHDLHSASFTAKQRSALPQDVPNKGREMVNHRNQSLCSHVSPYKARLSGTGAACYTDGKSKSNLRGDRESARMMALSGGAAAPRRRIDSGRWLFSLALPWALHINPLFSISPRAVMCPPLHCLNMGFLCSKYGYLRHARGYIRSRETSQRRESSESPQEQLLEQREASKHTTEEISHCKSKLSS